MRSGGKGSAGGGGRGKGGKSGTGSAAAVAGVIGAAAGGLPAAATAPATAAQMARSVAAPAPTVAKPKGVLAAVTAAEAGSGYASQREIRELAGGTKSAADFGKQNAFDREALSLAREGKVVLGYHDSPASQTKERLSQMVYDPTGDFKAHGVKGTWFATLTKA